MGRDMRKRLTETTTLRGIIEKISMTDLRQSPGDIIDQAQMGKIFIVTKGGKEVVTLQKLSRGYAYAICQS